MKVTLVIWHDAHGDASSWVDLDEIGDDGPCVVHSCGLRLKPGKGGKPGHVSIAQSMTHYGDVDSVLHIPSAMVVEIRDFEKVKPNNGKTRTNRRAGENSGGVSAPSNP